MHENNLREKWIGQDTLNYTQIMFHGNTLPKVHAEFEFLDNNDKSIHKARVDSIGK